MSIHAQVREELYQQYSHGLLEFDEMKGLVEAENDCEDQDAEEEDTETDCPEHGGSHDFTNKRKGGVWACDCGAESDGC